MPATLVKSGWSSGHLVFQNINGTSATYVRFGVTDAPLQVKVHNRPAVTGTTLEVRSRAVGTTAGHVATDSMAEWRPTGDTASAGALIGVQGVAYLYTGDTLTGGTLIGTYGQVRNDGTFNGAGLLAAGLYGLIEDGGTYTAVSRIAAAWLDSHLTKTVSSGNACFLYISNNGSTTFNEAIYVYAGNKITNLLTIGTASGMVSANTVGDATFANWKTIKVDLDGTTHYLIAAQSITG